MKALRHRTVLVAVGVGAIALAVVILLLTADHTPTTLHDRRFFGLWRASRAGIALGLALLAGGLFLAAASRRALLGYLSAGIGIAFVFIVLEAAGMLGVVSWPTLFNPPRGAMGFQRTPDIDATGVTFQDTAFAWGLASDPVEFHYKTDHRGFRNSPDRQDADIYLLGDSLLVAALVPFEKTLVARLESLAQRPVMQFALSGKGVQRMQQEFLDSDVDVRGRLVIQFVFEGNDLGDSRAFRTGVADASPAAASIKDRSLTKQLVVLLQKLTEPTPGIAAIRSCLIDNQRYTFLWTRESFDGYENEMPEIADSLSRLAQDVRSRGGEYAVVLIPSKLRVLGPLCTFSPDSDLHNFSDHLSPLPAYLHDWSNRAGIPLLDLTGSLQAAAQKRPIPWFWGDTHWNEIGQAAAAREIASWEPLKAGQPDAP